MTARPGREGLELPHVGDAELALLGTVLGGVGLKVVEFFLGRTKRIDDTATSLRTELRASVADLHAENKELHSRIDRLESSVDEWRDKYYALLAETSRRRR